jgi:hypothetical protein
MIMFDNVEFLTLPIYIESEIYDQVTLQGPRSRSTS